MPIDPASIVVGGGDPVGWGQQITQFFNDYEGFLPGDFLPEQVLLAYDWTGGDTWGTWDELYVNDDAGRNTYAYTIQTAQADGTALTSPPSVPNTKFARVANTAGTSGSQRMYICPNVSLLQPADDLEIMSLYRARNVVSSSRPQFGHAHRIINEGLGTQRAIVAWVDSLFNLDAFINLGQWVGGGASPGSITQVDAAGGGELPALKSYARVYNKALTANVATLTIAGNHELLVGDVIRVAISDATFDGNKTVTAVTPTTVSYAQTHADVASAAATGLLSKFSSTFPAWVCSRTVGPLLQVKAWRASTPEPSWSDERATCYQTMTTSPPTGPGRHGLVIAHVGPSESLDFGPVIFRRPRGITSR